MLTRQPDKRKIHLNSKLLGKNEVRKPAKDFSMEKEKNEGKQIQG